MAGAVCGWVRVRGEGGKGDWFVGPVVQRLLKFCSSGDEGLYTQSIVCIGVHVCMHVCVLTTTIF